MGSVSVESGHNNRTPNLLLTREKEPSVECQQKAKNLLLPNTFYNGDTTTRNTSLHQSDDENEDESTQGFNIVKNLSDENIMNFDFDEPATVYKFSRTSQDWHDLNDARVILTCPKSFLQTRATVLFAAGNHIYFQETISQELTLKFRTGQQTMLDFVVAGKSGKEDQYAIQFSDTSTAEKFMKKFTDEKSAKSSPGTSSFNSFASLAASGNSEFHSNAGKIFAGAGASLFGNTKKSGEEENEDERGADEGSHDVYVEPIIQLASVAVSSGEEEEDAFFNQRCKLYRFDTSSKKWKERGVGEMKLLRHRSSGKARLVMRRDQVRKICANHLLQPGMELKPFAMNDLAVTWTAFQDISEEIAEDVLLAAKFKNNEILNEFKNVFTKLSNNDLDGLQVVNCSYHAEEGSQVQARIGACDPKLAEAIKDA